MQGLILNKCLIHDWFSTKHLYLSSTENIIGSKQEIIAYLLVPKKLYIHRFVPFNLSINRLFCRSCVIS